MKHNTSKAVFAYWDGVRGDRLAPRRFEIDPGRIAGHLPFTFILERLDAETFRYRLAGTRMCEIFGIELRGTNFLDGWLEEDRFSLLRRLGVLSKQGAVELVQMEAAPAGHPSAAFEILLLPLHHATDLIDRVLGCFCPLEAPSWLGYVPLATKRVIANEFIWPAGNCGSTMLDLPERVPVLMQQSRTARIVRADKRHFRVFDGGLSRPLDDKG
jgi:hypothetical protein